MDKHFLYDTLLYISIRKVFMNYSDSQNMPKTIIQDHNNGQH